MTLFQQDFDEVMSESEGFDALPLETQRGLRIVAFTMWVKGVQQAQKAIKGGDQLTLVEDILADIIAFEKAKGKGELQ